MTKKPEENNITELSRRGFLTSVASGIAMTLAAPVAMATAVQVPAPVRDRELSFYNTHTGEQLNATFWADGDYLDDGVEEISWILRDHRADIATSIDPKLLDLLYRLQAKVDRQDKFHVISGYRCPATNAMLHKKSSGVAKRSYHMLGQAIDVRLPGFDTAKLRKAAKSLKGGGVGYYAKSDFIHLDVGPVRYW
jgi:uncharacterized protein YcbK (DUF882 family)